MDLLFNAGANDLDRHQWNEAVSYFREVEQQHPYSEWSRRSILMAAYAHYEGNNYAEAIADTDRFVALYPGNAQAAYAYYLKAICYFEQIVDVGHDQASTASARNALTEVVKRYPATEYAQDARIKLDMVADQLAGKEMSIGRYYMRNGNPIGAIGRFHSVVDTYQTTNDAPEALYRLVVAYLSLGLTKEAVENGAVLGYNYPGDPWYGEAYKLLTARGPATSGPALDQDLPAAGAPSPAPVPQSQIRDPELQAGVRQGGAARAVGRRAADPADPHPAAGRAGVGRRPSGFL